MSFPRLVYIALFILAVFAGLVFTEFAYASEESITSDRVGLELYMKCGCPSGAKLAGVRIEGMDASNTPFDVTTDRSGYAVIYGTPGLWQFTASKEGFKTNSWTMQVTQDDIKYPYLLNDNTNWISKVDTSGRLPNQELARLVMEIFPEGDVPGKEGESIRATAYAVARAESGGNPTAWGDCELGDSIGLWQINLCWHPEYSASELFDPDYNANAALEISNNGLDWTAWSTWKDDIYKRYLDEGRNELNQLSGIRSEVTLTLYVHDGSASGPIIQGAQVIGRDGSGSSFERTTGSNGYVTITGYPGTWSFSTSADGYETKIWDQEITETDTKDAYTQKKQQDSQSSVVGKWDVQSECESVDSVYGTGYLRENCIMEFNNDGTFTIQVLECYYQDYNGVWEECEEMTQELSIEPDGEWMQYGDTVRLQFYPLTGWKYEYDSGGYTQVLQYEVDACELTLNGDNMCGTIKYKYYYYDYIPDCPECSGYHDESGSEHYTARRIDIPVITTTQKTTTSSLTPA